MAEKFSLKDHLFNADTIGRLAAEHGAALSDFDADRFVRDCLAGFGTRELMERLDWIADQLQAQLAADFPTMADQLQAAMLPPLDPARTDDDFGHFIHAVPGILAVRHGMGHFDRAMDLLHAATQRFSMEFYIRPFLNAHPEQTWTCLERWAVDPNYHVRRLVSEGTRARLPWAKRLITDPLAPLALLDVLHDDPTRYVTRSVANHLNDIAKINPARVLECLAKWQAGGRQTDKEMTWMARHALRTLIKDGHSETMEFLGYKADADVTVDAITLSSTCVPIGSAMGIEVALSAPADEPVIVDYVLHLRKANGETAPKVFKMKDAVVRAQSGLMIRKTHKFKADATTFKLYPGPQRLEVQVNGRVCGGVNFELV